MPASVWDDGNGGVGLGFELPVGCTACVNRRARTAYVGPPVDRSSPSVGCRSLQVCIAEALRANRTVRELDLTGNAFTHVGAQDLAAALGENDSISSVKLRENAIGNTGVAVILAALLNNQASKVECVDCRCVNDHRQATAVCEIGCANGRHNTPPTTLTSLAGRSAANPRRVLC